MKKSVKKHITDLLKDESGQGTTEYILILLGVVAIAIVFGPQLKGKIGELMGNFSDKIGTFMSSI